MTVTSYLCLTYTLHGAGVRVQLMKSD